jgi:hypothetical protein
MRARQLLASDDLSVKQKRALRVSLLRIQAISEKPAQLPRLLRTAAPLFSANDQILFGEAATSADTLTEVLKA